MFKLPENITVDFEMDVDFMRPWLDAAFTLRVLNDAEHTSGVEDRVPSYARLVIPRLHAEIYDEICKIHSYEQETDFAAIEYLAVEWMMWLKQPEAYALLSAGKAAKSVISSEASAVMAVAKAAVFQPNDKTGVVKFLENILKAFVFVDGIDVKMLYQIEPVFAPLHSPKERPYIKDNNDSYAYPRPLQRLFKDHLSKLPNLSNSNFTLQYNTQDPNFLYKNMVRKYMNGGGL